MSSIRGHLTLSLTLAMAVLLTACGITVWTLAREALLRQFDLTLEAKSHIIRAGVEEDDGELEMEIKLEKLHGFDDASGQFFFEVRSSGGQPLLQSASLENTHLPALASGREKDRYYNITLPDGGPARAVAALLDAADDKKGLFRNITLITARRSDEFENTMRLLRWLLAATGAGALALMVPLIRHSLRRGLQPLALLAERTSAIDARNLDTRLPGQDSPAELRPVVTTLNALLERLNESFARERRFSSDVAHELRTPVSELKSLAELVTQWPEEATPEAFSQVLAIAGEMETVVESLRFLARAEEGTQPVKLNATALGDIIAEAASRHEALAEERGLILQSAIRDVELLTDAGLWRMIAANLIGNAVHHAPPGSVITVTLTDSRFTVSNQAPLLAPADIPQLFERFWRKDTARSGYGHSGLGLALVKSLTALLAHPLRAELSPNGLLSMSVDFAPAAAGTGTGKN
ncbi:MAG: ATP-binding protein [Verrucomicrobiota bacterium]